MELCKCVLAAQRDHGNREVRANARMKYLVHTLGIDAFKALVESYLGKPLEPWRPMPAWKYSDWLGWHDQARTPGLVAPPLFLALAFAILFFGFVARLRLTRCFLCVCCRARSFDPPQGDGNLFVGVNVEQGRIKDEGNVRVKAFFKKVASHYGLDMVLTPSQSVRDAPHPPPCLQGRFNRARASQHLSRH
jgi:sulfite reductase (ferredoxin)